MGLRYGNKVGPLVSRKSSFFKKDRFDSLHIKKPSSTIASSSNAWVRPADWLTMPTITSSEQKIALLMPVYPQGSNFLAFTIAGAYTVNWGDGVTENVDPAVIPVTGAKVRLNPACPPVPLITICGVNGSSSIVGDDPAALASFPELITQFPIFPAFAVNIPVLLTEKLGVVDDAVYPNMPLVFILIPAVDPFPAAAEV